MKVWVKKESVIASTKSLAVVGWAQKYNIWIEGRLQKRDLFYGKETCEVEFNFENKVRIIIPIHLINIDKNYIEKFFVGMGGLTIEEFIKIIPVVSKKVG